MRAPSFQRKKMLNQAQAQIRDSKTPAFNLLTYSVKKAIYAEILIQNKINEGNTCEANPKPTFSLDVPSLRCYKPNHVLNGCSFVCSSSGREEQPALVSNAMPRAVKLLTVSLKQELLLFLSQAQQTKLSTDNSSWRFMSSFGIHQGSL